MSPVKRARRPFHRLVGPAMAATLLLASVPAVAAAEPTDWVDGFVLVSATFDTSTDLPTVTYSFRCLEPIDLVRIRTTLVQRHAGDDAWASSSQTAAVIGCPAGATVSLAVVYGDQGNAFHAGPAALVSNLYAYEGTLTVDAASVIAAVRLHPSQP